MFYFLFLKTHLSIWSVKITLASKYGFGSWEHKYNEQDIDMLPEFAFPPWTLSFNITQGI